MTPFLQLIFMIAIIVLAAKAGGYLSTRIGQPSVFGELIVGLLLGPSLINLTHLPFVTDTHLPEVIAELGEIGVLLLMFIAGTELNLGELARNTKVAAYGGTLGVVLPVALGAGVGFLFGMDFNHAAFLGLTLGATSVSISAQTLMELGTLRSRVGLGLLGAAVFDDILVILLLSISTALLIGGSGGGAMEVLVIVVRMVAFLVLAVLVGLWIIPKLVRGISRLPVSQGLVSLAIVILIIYGVSAEILGGMAAITGTFIAGLMFGRTSERSRIENGISALAYSLFVPIFFVNIGLQVNVRELQASALLLLLAISVVAVLGKIFGSGLGSWLGGFDLRESFQLGVGMVSRGEVGLIVASVGLSAGLLDQTIFSAVVGMVLITTLVTPPMLRAAFAANTAAKPEVVGRSETMNE